MVIKCICANVFNTTHGFFVVVVENGKKRLCSTPCQRELIVLCWYGIPWHTSESNEFSNHRLNFTLTKTAYWTYRCNRMHVFKFFDSFSLSYHIFYTFFFTEFSSKYLFHFYIDSLCVANAENKRDKISHHESKCVALQMMWSYTLAIPGHEVQIKHHHHQQ